MPYPLHPDTLIVRNKYYSKGLTELDVYNYYLKNKWKLIKTLNNRTVYFNLAVGLNQTIIRRKGKGGEYFYLNSRNYEDTITGRTLVIISQMEYSENFGIIDIDVDNFDIAKDAANDVYEFLDKGGIDFVSSFQIRFTGKTSFHIFCNFHRKKNIDLTRQLFRSALHNSDLTRKYTVAAKRIKGIANLDLAINKNKGGFITLGSLSELGLPCTEVGIKELYRFKPEQLKIQ
jgi:hypothetical protein